MSASDDQQQRLRAAYEARQQEIKEAAERIYSERGADLEGRAAARDLSPLPDPEEHKAAAREMAQVLAERGVRTGNFDWRDHPGVPDEGIKRAEEKRAEQELKAESALDQPGEPRSELAAHQPEATPEREAAHDAVREPEIAQEMQLPSASEDLKQEQDQGQQPEAGGKRLRFYEDLERDHAKALEKREESKEQGQGGEKKLTFFEDRNPSQGHGIEH